MRGFQELLDDIWNYLKVRKKYWLGPLIITMIFMIVLTFLTQGTAIAPFIYSIF